AFRAGAVGVYAPHLLHLDHDRRAPFRPEFHRVEARRLGRGRHPQSTQRAVLVDPGRDLLQGPDRLAPHPRYGAGLRPPGSAGRRAQAADRPHGRVPDDRRLARLGDLDHPDEVPEGRAPALARRLDDVDGGAAARDSLAAARGSAGRGGPRNGLDRTVADSLHGARRQHRQPPALVRADPPPSNQRDRSLCAADAGLRGAVRRPHPRRAVHCMDARRRLDHARRGHHHYDPPAGPGRAVAGTVNMRAIVHRPSPNFDARRGGTPIDILALHYTGMPTAEGALARLCDPAAKVSAHYTIDEDGTIYRHVAEAERAWHAGVSCWAGARDINDRSIGIELVNPGHDFGYRAFPDAQIAAVIELARGIVERNRIPPARVLGHSDVAPKRKIDPGELFPWPRLAAEGLGVWPKRPRLDSSRSVQVPEIQRDL